ncbi:hypothetical protein [Nocardioides panaciterrulae]|uniref:Uncharacterized protein n=1 Tax=Nocardioides panaciterrulae TaxID=661492 RepID=A0A7Y9EA61_9ACTN|nr:hypothetical protein [Nocardioides panaciterrulae]NYD43934.1 hypothetical protein [Nocardioides panaciterrulae]NYD44003.1 hypothetical protein [Nocardioides panaciterrulae]
MTDTTERAEKKPAPRTPKARRVGSLWELKVSTDAPVVFEVSGPTGTRRVSARPVGADQVAVFVLDAPGDFTAVAHVDGADNVGGFAVTAK